jgi:O-antigen chain-terminating methyltransferase
MAAAYPGVHPMSDSFYRAFEEKHRGSRELIKSRLRAYLPFVEPLAELNKGAQTIDLGCGRGEWLELMTEVGFKSQGVDLDEGMLSGCVELGLSVEKGDAIAFLAALPSESQAIVSAFHVVEHISFEQLQTVVSEALRVLKPGGLLIMETPNPENIVVATCNFYLDPTHQRPIPPQLLSFLPEYHGFARIKTIRLQESKSLMQSASLTLHDVLDGVSPDYAVIAQKAAATDVFHRIDTAFEHEYGLNLATLAARYTAQLEAKAEHAQAHAQAQAQAQQFHQTLHDVFNSRSWRITAPLRWWGLQVRRLREQGFRARTKVLIKKIAQSFFRQCFAFIAANPVLRNRAVVLAQRTGVYQSFRSVYRGLLDHGHPMRTSAGHPLMPNHPTELSQLTPRAQEIYAELKSAIKNKQDSR